MTLKTKFEKLCKINPMLQILECHIREHKKANRHKKLYCANWHWYKRDGFKSSLITEVGHDSVYPELRTSEAYHTAYDYLYNLLPDCRGDCSCF